MEDYYTKMDEKSILATTDPFMLIAAITAMAVIAFVSASIYKNTNDFKKSVKLYVPLAFAAAIIFILLGLPIVFSVGTVAFGFIALMLISNYFFYK